MKWNVKIKTDQPMWHVADEFTLQQRNRGKISAVKFNKHNLYLGKTPEFYEMEEKDLVNAIVAAREESAVGSGGD